MSVNAVLGESITITVSATPSVATEVVLPRNTRTVNIQGFLADGTTAAPCFFVLNTGTDDAAIDAGRTTVQPSTLEVAISGQARVFDQTMFVASPTASAKIEVYCSNVAVS